MSLARGLDYYTGIIYEVIVEASTPPGLKQPDLSAPTPEHALPPTDSKKKGEPKKKAKAIEGDEEEDDESQVGVGSIAGGGRYDNLVGSFATAAAAGGKTAPGVPCVGVSIGMDRIFALLWPKWVERGMRSKDTMVYVMAAGDGLLKERIELACELREAGIQVKTAMHTCVVSFVNFLFHYRPTISPNPNPNYPRSSQREKRTKYPLLSS